MDSDELLMLAESIGQGGVFFDAKALQQFAQRIEAPHLQRIAELEKDCDILATNYDAARRASQFSADVADQALADLKAAEQQIEQLREALRLSKSDTGTACDNNPYDNSSFWSNW